jgi:glycosyltransferase involved in cell wall biosynthesis
VLEVVVVDDCSVDATSAVVEELGRADIRLIRHGVNQGKGAALRTGFSQASAPIVMIQDADLEYDPADYDDVLEPIIQGKAAVSYGSRFAGGRPHRVLYYWHMLGNRFLTLLSNMFTNLNLTDMETG